MQKAKLIIPKSISVALNGLTAKGFIQLLEQDGNKGMNYYITQEGIKYIEEYEKKDKKGKSIRKNKTTKKNIANRYSFLTKEMMNLEQYPEFSKLKSSKDKIMLIMYIMKEIDKGEYFTITELEYIISQIFNDKLSTDTIKGVFKNQSSAKYFDKRNVENNNKVNEYKMLQSGFNYFTENNINNNSGN